MKGRGYPSEKPRASFLIRSCSLNLRSKDHRAMKSQISQKQRSTILGLSSKGLKAPEIAEKLGLSMPTVRSIIIRHERADSWTRKRITPFEKARIAEAQSKAAMSESWVSYSHTFPNAAAKHW